MTTTMTMAAYHSLPLFFPTPCHTLFMIITCYCCCNCHALQLKQSLWSEPQQLSKSGLAISVWSRFQYPSLHRHRSKQLFYSIDNEDSLKRSISRIQQKQQDKSNDIHEIGVGIDLGTTNSAVAMMIPCNEDEYGDRKQLNTKSGVWNYRPIIIEHIFSEEVGENRAKETMITTTRRKRRGETTIPSVVALIPKENMTDSDQQSSQSSSILNIDADIELENPSLSLPPIWDTMTRTKVDGSVEASKLRCSEACQIHVGKAAMKYEYQYPNSTYRNVKRVIGTGGDIAKLSCGVVPNLFVYGANQNQNDVKKIRRKNSDGLPKLHKQLEEAKTKPAVLSCDIGSNHSFLSTSSRVDEMFLCPEQISACILRKLYESAELYWHDHNPNNSTTSLARVTRAVIGVPAYFTESQRQATILASKLAGVAQVKLLPEPEAAALAYGSFLSSSPLHHRSEDGEELILVFDLGGGTFDVSIVEIGGGISEVLATSGDNRLGGTDFDKRIAEYMCMRAVEYGRSQDLDFVAMKRRRKKDENKDCGNLKHGKEKRPIIKDWYRQGSGDVPNIILRVAEMIKIRLTNHKVVDVLVPLSEEGWKRIGCKDYEEGNFFVDPPFDKMRLEAEQGMFEDIDYIVITLDRNIFESICFNEIQRLLRPLREVAIMARVLLPGEARPSFVENAKSMMIETRTDNFFGELFDDDDNFTNRGDVTIDEMFLNGQALKQINAIDLRSQKKAQQRGRRLSRDINKRERSFRKQKQAAMDDAATASIFGRQGSANSSRIKQVGVGGKITATSPYQSTSIGGLSNERVQEGIHGRPLSQIILVGGAARMPVIGKLLEAVVGTAPRRTVNPDEAVALGCAVQVGILDGVNDGLLGGMQAVLSPMHAAVIRALAKKKRNDEGGLDVNIDSEVLMKKDVSILVGDEFDDEDDFY